MAPEKASHQALLILPTSVGSAEMKNHGKVKKELAVSLALEREREGLRNTGRTVRAPTQIIPPRDDVGL